MDRDQILAIYDPWYADSYDERIHGGDPWNDNLAGYKIEIVRELLAEGGRWLDTGCGTGKHLSALPDVEREGLDLSPWMVEKAREANPDITIHEGSYLDDHPEWVGHWDLVTNLWLSYQFVDSLRMLEDAISNLASWVAPTGSLFLHVADAEDVARGTILPWEDPEAPVYGDSIFITSVTWTWDEANGRTHHDLVAPQLQRMVNIVARDFEEVEVRRWPAIGIHSGRPKGVIGRKKRSTPISLAEVGTTYPYTLVYPPRDHPSEQDPSRPWDEDVPVPHVAPAPEPRAPEPQPPDPRIDEVRAAVDALRGELSSLAEAILPGSGSDEEPYDTLAVVHEQVWALRKDLADFYNAWDARAAAPAVAARPTAIGQVGTKRLAAEIVRRLNPLNRGPRRRRGVERS